MNNAQTVIHVTDGAGFWPVLSDRITLAHETRISVLVLRLILAFLLLLVGGRAAFRVWASLHGGKNEPSLHPG